MGNKSSSKATMAERGAYDGENERVAIITGGNAGLGFETAAELLERGWCVVLGCRSAERGASAAAALCARTGARASAIRVELLDTSSLDSVRAFAARVLLSTAHVHVLLNNAGIMMGEQRTSADGHELQFATNYLGHFLLTELLLGRLAASGTPEAPARIIHVSSIAGRFGRLQLDDIMHARSDYDSLRVYQQSKHAQIVYSHALARRLRDGGIMTVTSNSLEPGIVATSLSKGITDDEAMRKKLEQGVSVAEGAATQVLLAASAAPAVRDSSGEHWKDSRPMPDATSSLAAEQAAALLQLSAELAGLPSAAPPAPPAPKGGVAAPAAAVVLDAPASPPGAVRTAARRGDADALALAVAGCQSLAQLEDRDGPGMATTPASCAGGCSALVWAAFGGHLPCIQLLWAELRRVHAGDAVALRAALLDGNNVGENALMWAGANGHRDCIEWMWRECYTATFAGAEAGAMVAELQRRNRSFPALKLDRGKGRTLAMSASARGHTSVVEFVKQQEAAAQESQT